MPPKSPLFKVSLAHILAAISPVIATLAGALATWLLTNLHFLATFHVGSDGIAQAISKAVVFGVTAGGTYLIQHKFLSGIIELTKIERQAALMAPPRA